MDLGVGRNAVENLEGAQVENALQSVGQTARVSVFGPVCLQSIVGQVGKMEVTHRLLCQTSREK